MMRSDGVLSQTSAAASSRCSRISSPSSRRPSRSASCSRSSWRCRRKVRKWPPLPPGSKVNRSDLRQRCREAARWSSSEPQFRSEIKLILFPKLCIVIFENVLLRVIVECSYLIKFLRYCRFDCSLSTVRYETKSVDARLFFGNSPSLLQVIVECNNLIRFLRYHGSNVLRFNSINLSAAAAMFRDSAMTRADLDLTFTSYDLKRLELYSRNMVDYHLITDLLPTLTKLYFLNRLDVNFSAVQAVNSHAYRFYIFTVPFLQGF